MTEANRPRIEMDNGLVNLKRTALGKTVGASQISRHAWKRKQLRDKDNHEYATLSYN